MLRVSVTLLFVCTAAGGAFALDVTQSNTLEHVGQATAAASLCSKIEIDTLLVSALLSVKNLNLEDPQQQKIAFKAASETRKSFADWKEDSICVAAMMTYGPNGSVPGMLRWKTDNPQ
ncbi:MAG: hypothetical protein LCH99_37185 [Proteobacteria bacterium]|nr:hypothetical protein [Pseudomonadota bacterium]